MKKIGYIYKYSEEEKKGIIVYGTWQGRRSTNNDTPLLFYSVDCLSKVSTGQIVYFQFSDGKASRIERASLVNFDKELIDSLLTWKEENKTNDWVYRNTHIQFENLDDVEMPEEDFLKFRALESGNDISIEKELHTKEIIQRRKRPSRTRRIKHTKLPKGIEDLYECFGKYRHSFDELFDYEKTLFDEPTKEIISSSLDTKTINLLDLSLWLDATICQTEKDCFGRTFEQAKYLYDTFVLGRYINAKGNIESAKTSDNCISSSWSILLSSFDEQELRKLIKFAHKLQPALPVDFCKKNLNLLSDEYGMPDVEICRLYCQFQIEQVSTVEQYVRIEKKLYTYSHCVAKHKSEEGVPMCKMSKETLCKLSNKLEEQFDLVIREKVCAKISKYFDYNVLPDKENTHLSIEELIESSRSIDICNTFAVSLHDCYNIIEQFSKLSPKCQSALEKTFTTCINDTLVQEINRESVRPYDYIYCIEKLGEWVKEETMSYIKPILNEKYKDIEDIEELNYTYYHGFIQLENFFDQYKKLTFNYDVLQYIEVISNNNIFYTYPFEIQWYVVSNIIELLDYKSLDSSKYVVYNFQPIRNVRELLKWLHDQNRYNHISDDVLSLAESKICQSFSKEETWSLFEEKLVSSPGKDNISGYLDIYYRGEKVNTDILSLECFQEELFSKFVNSTDDRIRFLIADQLIGTYQSEAVEKSEGKFKLYLWLNNPTTPCSWDLIKNHLGELPYQKQNKLLRYIFYQIAIGELKLGIKELYTSLVNLGSSSCESVRGILFILKEKIANPDSRLSKISIEEVIGDQKENWNNFFNQSKTFFYPCRGYFAISQEEDTDILCFLGKLTKERINDIYFYVIDFYDRPINLFGKPYEFLDNEMIIRAKAVLERNISVTYSNDRYFILEAYEQELRHFVIDFYIDDKCNLVCGKQKSIELGFLPERNAVKPSYTNLKKQYEAADNYICRCGCFENIDQKITPSFYKWEQNEPGIPFYWCNKKMCVRRAHYLCPTSDWVNYKLSDFLFVLMGNDKKNAKLIWDITSEISRFCCDYREMYEDNLPFVSKKIVEAEEIGTWDENSSVFKNISDEDELDEEFSDYIEEDNNEYNIHNNTFEEPTYNRYNGSWAQDEMGYSDDDIDTIFDGDPDAYWNID